MQWNKTIPENGQFKILCMASEKKNECCMKLLNHCNLLLYAMHVLIKMENLKACGGRLVLSGSCVAVASPGLPSGSLPWLLLEFQR